jgi:hypothetical protein
MCCKDPGKMSDVVLREDVDGSGVKEVREWEWNASGSGRK